MAKKYPGLYLYFDWLECIESMGAKEGYPLIMNLYHYVKDGVRPKPLQGTSNMVQNICLAQIDRSKERGEIGRLGAEARYGTAKTKKSPTILPCLAKNTDTSKSAMTGIPGELLECGLDIDPEDDVNELLLLNRAAQQGREKFLASISTDRDTQTKEVTQ